MAKLTRQVYTSGNVQTNDHYPDGISGLIPNVALSAQNIVPANGSWKPGIAVVAKSQNRPGQTTQDLVDQTEQSATLLTAGSAINAGEASIGNAYGPTVKSGGNTNQTGSPQIVQNATYQGQDKGYSQTPGN